MSRTNDLTTNALFSVKGKNVLVTGGAGGLGTMMATAYIQNGANVIIASRKEKALKPLSEKLNSLGGGKCDYIVADLSSKAGCDIVAEGVKQRWNKLHAIVNNSGATWGARYNEVPEKEGWDRVMNLNVKALFFLTAALTDLLAKDATNIDPGRIINIASVAGLDAKAEGTSLSEPGQGLWSYNTSKAAAIHLTKTQAASLGPRKITANVICPGVFPSKMTAFGLQTAGDKMASFHPMGRVGTPEDMAGLALFLTSRASAHISGAVIPIDGGSLIAGRGYSGQVEASTVDAAAKAKL